MRKFLIGAAGVALALAVAAPATAETFHVRIGKGTGFRPASLTIKLGDSVRWENRAGENRQVVSNTGAFASPILARGKNWTFTFRAAGTYRYHDGLRPGQKGVVRVKGPPPSVSMNASSADARYGTQVTLSGVVSSRTAGQAVTILTQPYPQSTFADFATVTTTAGGAWAVSTTPTIQTSYQARYRGATSQPVTVGVRPRVTFSYRHGYMSTLVMAATSFAHRFVWVQRRSRFGQWVSVRKLELGLHSGRIFRPPGRKGTSTYRIFLTINQAGRGYLSSHSGTQRVRRR
jgi:plastocyanin